MGLVREDFGTPMWENMDCCFAGSSVAEGPFVHGLNRARRLGISSYVDFNSVCEGSRLMGIVGRHMEIGEDFVKVDGTREDE